MQGHPTCLTLTFKHSNIMHNYKFSNGTILTKTQVMEQYDLEDEEDLEVWADDHYNPVTNTYDL